MISGKCNAGGCPAMNEHHIQGGVLIVLVAEKIGIGSVCIGNWHYAGRLNPFQVCCLYLGSL